MAPKRNWSSGLGAVAILSERSKQQGPRDQCTASSSQRQHAGDVDYELPSIDAVLD
jgi:hypothetical protein